MKTNRVVQARTHEGARAYQGSPAKQLRRSVMACMLWEDSFYESGQSIAERIAALVPKVPVDEVARIAADARSRYKIRHAPLLIAAVASGVHQGRAVGDMVAEIIQRPDEAGELLSIYRMIGKSRTIPRQIKIGIGRALRKFDAYQLAKWDSSRAAFKLADVIRLCHVKAGADKDFAHLMAKIANREYVPAEVAERYGFDPKDVGLPTPDTWETALSAGANKAETFVRLIAENKLGALALLRNLRGMTEAGVPDQIIRDALGKSKPARVLPFRFITAARHAPQFEPELEAMMLQCLEEHERLDGRTAVLVDVSGSMAAPVSSKSEVSRIDAACGLAIIMREICPQVDVYAFGTGVEQVPSRRGFALADVIKRADVGPGTNIGRAVSFAAQKAPARMVVITDAQSQDQVGAPTGIGYMINVAAYEHGVGYGPWLRVDGWSEAIAGYIVENEQKARTAEAA